MNNLSLGIGTHSSRFPSHHDLFSQWKEHFAPHIPRTVASVSEQNRLRIAAGGEPTHYQSVHAEPIELLKCHPNKDQLSDILTVAPLHNLTLDILTVAPLHNLTLIAPVLLKYVVKLDLHVAVDFLLELVKPDPKRGKSSLLGLPGIKAEKFWDHQLHSSHSWLHSVDSTRSAATIQLKRRGAVNCWKREHGWETVCVPLAQNGRYFGGPPPAEAISEKNNSFQEKEFFCSKNPWKIDPAVRRGGIVSPRPPRLHQNSPPKKIRFDPKKNNA